MVVNVPANHRYVQGWTNHVHSICLLAVFQHQVVEGTWVVLLQPTRLLKSNQRMFLRTPEDISIRVCPRIGDQNVWHLNRESTECDKTEKGNST